MDITQGKEFLKTAAKIEELKDDCIFQLASDIKKNGPDYIAKIKLRRIMDHKMKFDMATKFSNKEIAWLMNNLRFWEKFIGNKNARKIFYHFYKQRAWNVYTLSKRGRGVTNLSYPTVKHWVEKLRFRGLVFIDMDYSYGNERLYILNRREYPNIITLTYHFILEEMVKE